METGMAVFPGDVETPILRGSQRRESAAAVQVARNPMPTGRRRVRKFGIIPAMAP
jgi:hypothetical protein